MRASTTMVGAFRPRSTEDSMLALTAAAPASSCRVRPRSRRRRLDARPEFRELNHFAIIVVIFTITNLSGQAAPGASGQRRGAGETRVLMEPERARVRPAGRADLAAVAGILAFYVTNSVATFEEDAAGPAAMAAAAGQPGRSGGCRSWSPRPAATVAGYAYASPWRPKPAYRHTAEDSVYLAPGQRGRGLGRLLLEALLTGCADTGVRQVIAVIADSGDPASVLLHRSGFTDAGLVIRSSSARPLG